MTNNYHKPKETPNMMPLSDNEKDLIDFIRTIECAEFYVYVQDFIPMRVERVLESIQLGRGKVKPNN